MPHDPPARSIEPAARRIKRRKLTVWAIRQSIAAVLAAWLFPKHPWLWWSLVFIVPLALFSLVQILRLEQLARRGAEIDDLRRRIGGG